jgi:hypothetical protein
MLENIYNIFTPQIKKIFKGLIAEMITEGVLDLR